MAKIAYFDYEAGSVDVKRCGLTQLSVQIEINHVLVAAANWFIRPNEHDEITLKAMEIQKISPADLLTEKYRPYEEVFPQLEAFLGLYVDRYNTADKYLFGGYNARFDEECTRRFFKQNNNNFFGSWFWSGPLDVMAIATHVYQDHRHLLDSFSLGSLLRAYNIMDEEGNILHTDGTIAEVGQLHDSRTDIDGTRRLYHRLIGRGTPPPGAWPTDSHQIIFIEPKDVPQACPPKTK